jgi:hypothetical protein
MSKQYLTRRRFFFTSASGRSWWNNTFRAQLFMALKLGRIRKKIRKKAYFWSYEIFEERCWNSV